MDQEVDWRSLTVTGVQWRIWLPLDCSTMCGEEVRLWVHQDDPRGPWELG